MGGGLHLLLEFRVAVADGTVTMLYNRSGKEEQYVSNFAGD